MQAIFFENWMVLLRTMIVGVLAYAALIVLLRVSGKRTLSKMNSFDLIVTVALGSTLASALITKDVSLAQGVVAFAVLIGLQFAITWTSVRFGRVRDFVTGEPTMLLFRGEPLREAMRRERITQKEVEAAVRSAGLSRMVDAHAVVLETDGSLSVIQNSVAADQVVGMKDRQPRTDA